MALAVTDYANSPRIGLAACKANLSGIVSDAERYGTATVVMRYGKPAAVVIPFPEDQAAKTAAAKGLLSDFADEGKAGLEASAFMSAMIRKHTDE